MSIALYASFNGDRVNCEHPSKFVTDGMMKATNTLTQAAKCRWIANKWYFKWRKGWSDYRRPITLSITERSREMGSATKRTKCSTNEMKWSPFSWHAWPLFSFCTLFIRFVSNRTELRFSAWKANVLWLLFEFNCYLPENSIEIFRLRQAFMVK